MWILLTENDTVQPGDEYYDEDLRDWSPVYNESEDDGEIGYIDPCELIYIGGTEPPKASDLGPVRRNLTGWDAVERVIDTEIPADSTQALKCLVRMLRAKTAPTDP